MEDYDLFGEMQDLKNKKTIIIIEDDEYFILKKFINSNFEIIPIRYSYDLSCFSDDYINKTKKFFIYYYNSQNTYTNELLRLKKHFVHYQLKPKIAYIPPDNKYSSLKMMLVELGVKCFENKEDLLKEICDNKLILIDNDATLSKSDGTISKRTKEAILKNRLIGNKIIICTSRPRYQAIEIMKESGADDIIISSNGAEIYDNKTKKIIFSSFIDNKEIIKLVEYAYSKDIRLILTLDDFDYVTKDIRNPNQKLLNKDNYKNELLNYNIKQCMFIDKKNNEIYKAKKLILENRTLCIVDEINDNNSYKGKWFSVANFDVSKGNTLKILANYLNVSIENTIAIGNGKNDVSMFKTCGFSVAVDNASESIKKTVDYVTLTNDKDGVAVFLESLIT